MIRPPSTEFRARRSGCQAMMPSASPFSTAAKHLLEDGTARRLGALGLFEDPDDREAPGRRMAFHLGALGIDREDLAILGFA